MGGDIVSIKVHGGAKLLPCDNEGASAAFPWAGSVDLWHRALSFRCRQLGGAGFTPASAAFTPLLFVIYVSRVM